MIYDEQKLKTITVGRTKKKEPRVSNYRSDNDIFGTNKDKKILPKSEYSKISKDTSEQRLSKQIRVNILNFRMPLLT